MVKKLMAYITASKWRFALALLLATATILAGIGLMTSSGYLISRAAQRPMIVDLFMVTAAVRFFGISRGVVRYLERLVSHDLTFRILQSMRQSLYRKFDAFSQKWLMGRRPGDLLAVIITDIETLQNVYLRLYAPAIVALIISVLTFAGLTFFDLRLATVILFLLLLNATLVPYFFFIFTKGRGRKEVATRTALKVFLVDRLQGVQEIIWMGQNKNVRKEFDLMQERLDSTQSRNAGTSGVAEALNSLMSQLAMFAALILAIPLVISGEIKGVWLAALTMGVLSSFEAAQGLANAFIHYEASAEAANRLFSMAESEKDAPNQPHEQCFKGITFNKVSFSYGRENITLSNISLAIPPGSRTAIVGPTGSGKSTLVNLLLGFWHPDQGTIEAGGVDIRKLQLDSYRSLFGVASQDAHIFNRSLRDNLLMANPEASDLQINSALETVGLGWFAANLDMEPGNLGMRLSGGERQLLAIARVLLKDAPLWIFDEPTANLDVNTERSVLNTIWAQGERRTLVFITHRLLDMEKMDQIVVMDRGEIAEQGSHENLLLADKLYARMYRDQLQLIRE